MSIDYFKYYKTQSNTIHCLVIPLSIYIAFYLIMSSINTIAINTAETSPVVLAGAGGAKPKPVVQRKKKTFPVVARCEGAELESAKTLELRTNVRVRGITVEDLSSQVIVIEPSIADTLLNIIQTKPDIKAPAIRKKKPISVADVIGSVNDAPKPAKKPTKNDKKRENMPPIDVEGAILVQPEVLVEIVQPATVVPKAVKKRAPKKKAEVVITEPVLENIESTLENIQIQEPLGEIVQQKPLVEIVQQETVIPKVVKKRAPKKKAEVVITEPVLENIESTLENIQIQEPLGEIVQPATVVPKVVKKRAPKKKAEVVITEPVLENIESTLENIQIQEPLGEIIQPATVVPKVVKKRAPKKKAEVVITEPVLENIESNTFNLATIQDALGEIAITCEDKSSTASLNALDTKNPMEWFDEQAKQIDLRREPILNTFYVPLPELDEELYQLNTLSYEDKSSSDNPRTPTFVPNSGVLANTLYNNRFAYEEKSSTASLMPHSSVREIAHVEEYPVQPIYDGLSNIIANTLENEDYSDEIMVESLEFNGQTYWIDAQHNVLNKDTFDHIGVYKPETATIAFY